MARALLHSSAKFGTTITITYMAALRQPSTHVPACGTPTRDAAAARLFEILHAAPEYHAAVQRLRGLGKLKDYLAPNSGCDCWLWHGTAPAGRRQRRRCSRISSSRLTPPRWRRTCVVHSSCSIRQQAVVMATRQNSATSAGARPAGVGCAPVRVAWRGHGTSARRAWYDPRLGRGLAARFDAADTRQGSCRPLFEHVYVAYFAAVREALELEDVGLPVRLALGAIVAGDLPAVHVWESAKEAFVPRPLGLDYDDLPHAQWNAWLAEDLERRAQSQSGADGGALGAHPGGARPRPVRRSFHSRRPCLASIRGAACAASRRAE